MGKIEIEDREWLRDTEFWFALDGPVTVESNPGEALEAESHKSKEWIIKKGNSGTWKLFRSNPSKTPNHTGSGCLNEWPETPEEVFCRFTTQIVEYDKPISFSPHNETLKWEREEQ